MPALERARVAGVVLDMCLLYRARRKAQAIRELSLKIRALDPARIVCRTFVIVHADIDQKMPRQRKLANCALALEVLVLGNRLRPTCSGQGEQEG
jgi:hypothetical protein